MKCRQDDTLPFRAFFAKHEYAVPPHDPGLRVYSAPTATFDVLFASDAHTRAHAAMIAWRPAAAAIDQERFEVRPLIVGHQSANQGCPPQRAALNQFAILAPIALSARPNPAPKSGTAVRKEAVAKKDEGQAKDKTTSDLSKAEGGEKLPIYPQVIVGARAKNQFLKLIRITGTRFTRKGKRRSGSWINGTDIAVVRRASRVNRSQCHATTLETMKRRGMPPRRMVRAHIA